MSLSLPFPDELLDELAEKVATILAAECEHEREAASPWLYGAQAAADYLGCPLDRVKRLTAAGVIPHRKQDGRCFYKRDELADWLDEGYEGPARGLRDVSRTFPRTRDAA